MKASRLVTRFILLFLLCVQVQITVSSCAKDQGPDGPDLSSIGTIYTPTNDYNVRAVITGIGFFSCSRVTVMDGEGNIVNDASVEVNNAVLPYDGVADQYTDEEDPLESEEGTVYELAITVGNEIIAEGIAQMPTTPTIISPVDSATHPMNQTLAVRTNKIKYATSVYVMLETPYMDAEGNWLDDTTYAFSVTSGSQEITIPASYFDVSGTYTLEIEAMSGLTQSLMVLQMEEFEQDMGYNIRGPKGLFVAYAPGESQTLFVTSGGISTTVQGAIRYGFPHHLRVERPP